MTLRSRLTSSCSTPLGAALVAVNLVTVRTRVIQFVADVDEGIEIPRLRRPAGELSHFHECSNVLLPIGAVHGDGFAVLAPASRRQEERCSLGDRNGGLINGKPSRINSRSPFDIVKR